MVLDECRVYTGQCVQMCCPIIINLEALLTHIFTKMTQVTSWLSLEESWKKELKKGPYDTYSLKNIVFQWILHTQRSYLEEDL